MQQERCGRNELIEDGELISIDSRSFSKKRIPMSTRHITILPHGTICAFHSLSLRERVGVRGKFKSSDCAVWKYKTWLAVLWLCLASPVIATTPDATLNQAIDAYSQAQEATGRGERLAGFRQAQRLFEHAVAQGARSAALYTNLGNAALQAERLGSAILAYRRALMLDPDQAQAHQNLRHARTRLPAWVPKPEFEGAPESLFIWRHLLNPTEQAVIAALAFLLAALLIAAAIRWRSPLARNLAFLPLLAWLGLLLSAMIQARAGGTNQAVLIADETIARAADSPNAPMRFAQPLPAGTEVEIRESRTHWVHVVLANGRDAWVKWDAVEAV